MSETVWIGPRLYLGRVVIGRISEGWSPGPAGETIAAICFLPGATTVVGVCATPIEAKERVLKSAQSRVKAMFGAGIDTTSAAVRDSRRLRVVARTILRAGLWTCSKPVNGEAMFDDLRIALGMAIEDCPTSDGLREHREWRRSRKPLRQDQQDFNPIEN